LGAYPPKGDFKVHLQSGILKASKIISKLHKTVKHGVLGPKSGVKVYFSIKKCKKVV
jgi:hypothetical protein